MIVKKLTLRHFRNIEEAVLDPCDGMNVICGENANGKTNLMEAIWLFTGAKSFRGAKDAQMPQFTHPAAKLALDFCAGGVDRQAELTIDTHRHAAINGKNLHSAAELAGQFCAIVFSPTDLGLVIDGPAVRRRFLDVALCEAHPAYLTYLRQYMRAVTQRNAVLKEGRKGVLDSDLLDVFEEEIAGNGAKILAFRERYLQRVQPVVQAIYRGISTEKETLSLSYEATASADDLRDALRAARAEDRYSAVTSVGPHRDDLELTVNGLSARQFGSQGQKRSVALSLKLSEAELLNEIAGEYPVALLDDVMSELDPARQRYVLNHIEGWQVFLTCCDPANTVSMASGRRFTMRGGRLEA